MAKKTYTLYLAKAGWGAHQDVLTDRARDSLDVATASQYDQPDFGDGATLYVFPGRGRPPSWLAGAREVFDGVPDLQNQSHAAVITFQEGDNLFALSYGHGWLYLDDDRFEGDFGLRATVNFLSDEKLKSLERSNVGIAMRDVTQSARHSGLRDFGMDDALEVIRKISGTSEGDGFVAKATGARSLKIVVEQNLRDVPGLAREAFDLSRSDRYLTTSFRVIDFLQPVTDAETEADLNDLLVMEIRGEVREFELSIPQFTSDDVSYVKFQGCGGRSTFSGVSLLTYLRLLGDRAEELSIDTLKSHRVLAYDNEFESPVGNWTVFRSLVGSLASGGIRYALNEGEWYQLDTQFKDSAEQHYNDCELDFDQQLPAVVRTCEGRGASVRYAMEPEGSYNERAAEVSNYVCLDRELVQIEGAAGPGVELCDLLDIEGKRFIHVKKGGRNSGVLSHLFRQGAASANLFKASERIRDQLVEIVRVKCGEGAAQRLIQQIAGGGRWTVEYRVIDTPRRDGRFDIPFFSKLSLKDEGFRIRAMGMDVRIGFIRCADR